MNPGQKSNDIALLNSENLKIIEVIHYSEESMLVPDLDVMKLTINKDNRKFCVMGREDNIWKSLGVKTETWDDSITIRIGFRGQDYEFQVHKVKPGSAVQGTHTDSTRCPSTVISPITRQDGCTDQLLELPQEVPNGGVFSSGMAQSKSISTNSNKSSALKDPYETPSKVSSLGFRFDKVSLESVLGKDYARITSNQTQQGSSLGSSGSKTQEARVARQLDKFLSSWRDSTSRPDLRQSIAFLEIQLMEAEYQLLEKPLVRVYIPEKDVPSESEQHNDPLFLQPHSANLFQEQMVRSAQHEEQGAGLDLDMGFIWADSEDSFTKTDTKQRQKESGTSNKDQLRQRHQHRPWMACHSQWVEEPQADQRSDR